MSTQLSFNNINFNTIIRNSQIWLSSKDIAAALGYAKTNAITKVYNQNTDEFTAGMTDVVEVPNLGTSGNLKVRTRIFSLRGAHLIAMFARTEIAKEFRRWVLDILDREVEQTPPAPTPTEEILHFKLTRSEACSLCWLWNAAEYMREQIAAVHPALNALQSTLTGKFYSMSFEYKHTLDTAKRILEREMQTLTPHPHNDIDSNLRRVLPRLRSRKTSEM